MRLGDGSQQRGLGAGRSGAAISTPAANNASPITQPVHESERLVVKASSFQCTHPA
ncbi:MAG TPA: hypothetical protein VGB41_04910 [Acidimicrobiia bacterium]